MAFCQKRVLLFSLFAAAAFVANPGFAQSPAYPETAKGWLMAAVETICPLSDRSGLAAQNALPGSWLLEETVFPDRGAPGLSKIHLALPDAAELQLEARLVGNQLRQFRASFHALEDGLLEPKMLAIADGKCRIQSARRLRSEGAAWRYLDQLDGDLATLRWTETLQAPWPDGEDTGRVRVALIDSGLAYDLPGFADRLARDVDGTPLGYDYWDLDPWPYDGDMSRGPFLPIRHGTAVASILLREAPNASLIPLRYPRPDMSRLVEAVAYAKSAGAKVIAMPLGSNRAMDWEAFGKALLDHDILAIVSAGNDGRDIDVAPVFPAAQENANIITVTSADAFGRLAQGSNWGARHVDIMLPAENMDVIDFRGARGVASGSSYAVPRLAAVAARFLEVEPDLSAEEIKKRLFARAAPSPFERDNVVAVGWIADPLED